MKIVMRQFSKNPVKFLVGLLLAVFASQSCASLKQPSMSIEQEYLDECFGCTYDEVVSVFGLPESYLPDGNGGYIISYVKRDVSVFHSGLASLRERRARFFFDSDNRCYNVLADLPMKGGKWERYKRNKAVSTVAGFVTGFLLGDMLVFWAMSDGFN